MIYKTIPMEMKNSSEKAKVTTYLIEHSEEIGIVKRPVVVVCPGGGYEFVSDREAEMVALKFFRLSCSRSAVFGFTGCRISDGTDRTCKRSCHVT